MKKICILPYGCNDLSKKSTALGCEYHRKQDQPEIQQMQNSLQKDKTKLCTGFLAS